MASGIHRERMDQFFAAKKIKVQENCVKNGSNEKSPGAKRSLDNFLVTRRCDDCETSGRDDEVKRRLIMDSSLSDAPLPAHESSTQPVAAVIQEENMELKKFAEGFLSLFCSDLQPSQGSPLEKRSITHKPEDCFSFPSSDKKTPKKRRCTDDIDMVQFQFSMNKKNEVQGEMDRSLNEIQGGIKKCTTILDSDPTKKECSTPILSGLGVSVRETPKSVRGSSLVSPGESFWNEAIQVVDCLFAPKSIVDEKTANCNTSQHNCSVVSGENNEHIKEVSLPEINASTEFLRVNDEEPGKRDLPLPVKHFDFSSEEDNLKDNKTFEAEAENKSDKIGEGVRDTIQIHEDVENNQLNEVFESSFLLSAEMRMNSLKDNCRVIPTTLKNVENLSPTNSCEPSIASPLQPPESLLNVSNWVPAQMCSIYKKIGISQLFPWQVDCLNVEGVLNNKNLVYCASTSAGKSFVAEILMIRRIISTGKIALLVLPYVSICVEKAEHLEALLEPIGKHVRSFFGNQGGSSLPNDTSVAVCTIEKANILVNRLLEEGRLSEVGIIVIDELHMVGDRNRGYLLELLLTKLRYASGGYINEDPSGEIVDSCSSKCDSNQELQIVGMSATMPNVSAVAQWLQAALYQTDFRPVPLEEFFKVGNAIYNKKMEVVRTLKKSCDLGGKDPDHIVELCNEVVEEGNSVLVFCSSRKGCESTAKHVAKFITRFSVVSVHSEKKSDISDVDSAIDALEKCPVGLDPILHETIPHGVAYHHAGLTVEEREIVETCYRNGLVRVLAATSTLAAGVNLPARRVIFRQPKVGREFIDGQKYKQMSGRAGRSGIDSKGESLLICKKEEVKRIIGIINEGIPPLASCLSEDKNGMTHAILEVVASGIVQTANDIHRYVRCTLLNCIRPFEDVVKSAQDSLRWLCRRKFLEWNEKTKLYNVTPLGRASFGSSLCPEESLLVLDDISRAREGFVLASDLHLVYLVTPINVDVEPDWELYYEKFLQLSALDQSVGNRVGVAEQFLMRFAHNGPPLISKKSGEKRKMMSSKSEHRPGDSPLDDQLLRVCKRFYVALILSRLVQEEPVSEVCEAYKVSRGIVQSLQENAGRFASMISVFCERLGWCDLEVLVSKFQNRVSFGVRAEIVELTTIPYVKGSRARALYKAGLRSTLAIAEASVLEIVGAVFSSTSWTSEDYTQRGMQFGTAKKIKNAARKIIFDKAEEARVAAFSAFKSLGLKMEQLPGVQLATCSPIVIGKVVGQEVLADPSEGPGSGYDTGTVSSIPDMEEQKSIKQSGSSLEISAPTTIQSPAATEIHSLHNVSSCPALQNSENIRLTGVKEINSFGNTHTVDFKAAASDMGPVNATQAFEGIDSFLDVWESIGEFCFDIHFGKKSRDNCHLPFELHGIALCWEHSPVYYVDILKDILLYTRAGFDSGKDVDSFNQMWETATKRWARIGNIFGKNGVKKMAWNVKVQIQVLKFSGFSISRLGKLNPVDSGIELVDGAYLPLAPIYMHNVIDLSIVAWILWPDEEKYSVPNLEKEAKKRLSSEDAAAAHRKGRWNNQMSEAAHNGCCRHVAQIQALCSIFFKILLSEGLLDVIMDIEMPLVHILAEMEVCGVGIEMEKCLRARHLLREKLINHEKEAYKLAGMVFSLYTPADISNVLFTHMKLPFPDQCNKGKRHLSTDKHCLDILRNEHPIVPVIMEHRVLAKLKNTLSAICSLARKPMCANNIHTLHGRWLQTSTGTGRLSTEEPNLQCIEHTIELSSRSEDVGDGSDNFTINVRDFFVPTQENWLLLTADYSQIELCIMAHFSKDQSLIEILSRPNGDLFSLIVVRWMGKSEEAVTSSEREQTKKLIYGILYGMGANKLSKQLECSSVEAAEKIKSFKSSFPDVSAWILRSIESCRQNGYITTLKGRKRFLSKIRFGTLKEKLKAERQAVNSICQGSAADIIKIAMINMYSVISGRGKILNSNTGDEEQFGMLKNQCRLILQMHDELVIEADPSVVNQAALLLKKSMETATSLLVPLKVRMMIGRTWGSLKPFEFDKIV